MAFDIAMICLFAGILISVFIGVIWRSYPCYAIAVAHTVCFCYLCHVGRVRQEAYFKTSCPTYLGQTENNRAAYMCADGKIHTR